MTTFTNRPEVLSFTRGMNVSDAPMFNLVDGELGPKIEVIRAGVLGTQNVGKKGVEKDVANPIITETAKTDTNSEGLGVEFNIAILPIKTLLYACSGTNQQEFRTSIESFLERAESGDALKTLALHYARNIANARFLGRNRTIGVDIQVEAQKDGDEVRFNALDVPLSHFDNPSDDEKALANWIEDGLLGDSSAPIRVIAKCYFGFKGSMQVYPSQNYVKDTPTGFSRSLYKKGGSENHKHNNDPMSFTDQLKVGKAALRDTKLANALRTIDVWYPDFEDVGMPIPVEPLGANLKMSVFYRPNKDQANNAFGIIRMLDEIEPDSAKGLYMLAALMRGGVYSEKDE